MGNWADSAVRRTLELRLCRSGASCARFGIFATAWTTTRAFRTNTLARRRSLPSP